mgnify:CR=1 FL=1
MRETSVIRSSTRSSSVPSFSRFTPSVNASPSDAADGVAVQAIQLARQGEGRFHVGDCLWKDDPERRDLIDGRIRRVAAAIAGGEQHFAPGQAHQFGQADELFSFMRLDFKFFGQQFDCQA